MSKEVLADFSKMSIRLLVLFSAFLIQLLWVTAGRVGYPFEIEWMEGGMLTHAIRLAEGQAIYAQPSASFVPFFYTPGYPALLAAFGQIFGGVDFALARAVSLAATLITMWLLFQLFVERQMCALVLLLSVYMQHCFGPMVPSMTSRDPTPSIWRSFLWLYSNLSRSSMAGRIRSVHSFVSRS